jgi:CheY-like chemotaxis protein/HPt (histidine-containing phosphotransfer) domain-containing protein
VLLVDDNATNRRILTLQTKAWGMASVAVASGPEALDVLKRGEMFDLAILDMHMPEMDGLMLAERIRRYRDPRALPLLMLTSLGNRDGDARFQEFRAFLTKPVKASQLYNTLLGMFAEETARAISAVGSVFDPQLGERLPLRMLLVEDNATNQKLALLLLQKLGYRADVAGNGLEALAALRRQPYDLVFMDVQMPAMDGLEATRHIRAEFSPEAQPRVIAMTANAMQGDREMCLQAGMNDYISKPVQVPELRAAIERWGYAFQAATPERSSGPASASASALTPALAPIDWEAFRVMYPENTNGDLAVIREIAALFVDELPKLRAKIHEAVAREDSATLRRAAHSLKGSSAAINAKPLATLCAELEKLGRYGTVVGAAGLLADLDAECARVAHALTTEVDRLA